MGGSIALLFARHGYEVAVYDIEQKGLDRCRKRIQKEIAGAEIIFTREKECLQGRDLWLRPLWKT